MALVLVSHGEKNVALGYDTTTGERGFLVRFINKSGGASVKGHIVAASSAVDNAVTIETSGFDPIGVFAESGIPDGSAAWVWMNGSVAQVMYKDGVAATRGYVALCDDTDGMAYDVAVPSSNPVVAEHFRELGHVMESKTAGTSVLALVCLHFN